MRWVWPAKPKRPAFPVFTWRRLLGTSRYTTESRALSRSSIWPPRGGPFAELVVALAAQGGVGLGGLGSLAPEGLLGRGRPAESRRGRATPRAAATRTMATPFAPDTES